MRKDRLRLCMEVAAAHSRLMNDPEVDKRNIRVLVGGFFQALLPPYNSDDQLDLKTDLSEESTLYYPQFNSTDN